jgi:hypothetical protein
VGDHGFIPIRYQVTMSTDGHLSLAQFQLFDRVAASAPSIDSIENEIVQALSSLNLPAEKLRGRNIAVSVGSRGIACVNEITRAICQWLLAQGAHPFAFPAMGSHGGGTAEGQRKILEDYGVTPEFIGAPIRSSMETVSLGLTVAGIPVVMDRQAWEADSVLVMNRVRPHTTFSGTIESGLLKMMAIGMGKIDGARECHAAFRKHGYESVIRSVSAKVLASGKILGGLGVIENEMHRICAVRSSRSEGIVALDESCLNTARQLVPRLPFPKIQLLIVDEIGKNISGTGMDAKVIGRGVQPPLGDAPQIDLIYARDLTDESGGNALGVGLADFVHQRLRRKIDFEQMYVNARTSMSHNLVRLPMVFPFDREAIDFGLQLLGNLSQSDQRIVWIRNTQNLGRISISEAMAREASGLQGWQPAPQLIQPEFDAEGNLVSVL